MREKIFFPQFFDLLSKVIKFLVVLQTVMIVNLTHIPNQTKFTINFEIFNEFWNSAQVFSINKIIIVNDSNRLFSKHFRQKKIVESFTKIPLLRSF